MIIFVKSFKTDVIVFIGDVTMTDNIQSIDTENTLQRDQKKNA
jgi:hypothetical protein